MARVGRFIKDKKKLKPIIKLIQEKTISFLSDFKFFPFSIMNAVGKRTERSKKRKNKKLLLVS